MMVTNFDGEGSIAGKGFQKVLFLNVFHFPGQERRIKKSF